MIYEKSPEYHVRIAPHRKPCQQFTYGYVRKSYIQYTEKDTL